jgi:hypothetical protein
VHQVAVMAVGDGFRVADVRCTGGPEGFDVPEVERAHLLVAAQRGAFLRREGGTEVLVDGTVAYLSAPGLVEQFAHPLPGGDVCTAISFAPSLLGSLTGGDPAAAHAVLPMDAASELALRRLTALARRGYPGGSLAEQVIRLAAALLARRLPERIGSGRPATAAARRRVVSQAKAALAADTGRRPTRPGIPAPSFPPPTCSRWIRPITPASGGSCPARSPPRR